MAELRQLVAYAFALTIVLFLLTFGVRVSFVEAARYLPLTAPPETNSLNRAAELVSAPAVHVASAQSTGMDRANPEVSIRSEAHDC